MGGVRSWRYGAAALLICNTITTKFFSLSVYFTVELFLGRRFSRQNVIAFGHQHVVVRTFGKFDEMEQ